MPTKIGRTMYVTANEAAVMGDMKRDTFTAYVSRGRAPAPALELGGRKFYKQSAIVAWLQTRRGQGWRKGVKV